jgi:hypothetical protein
MSQRERAIYNTLPLPVNRLIGREQEMLEIKGRLPTTQLLTLTGAGGCGKTRLALQLGADASSTVAFTTTSGSPLGILHSSPSLI